MPLKIGTPIVKEFALDQSDPTGETKVTIRQGTQLQHDVMSDLFAESTYTYNDRERGKVEQKVRYSVAEVRRLSIRMTMVGCNVERAAGVPLFKFKAGPQGLPELDMTEKEFNDAYGALNPPELTDEIYEKVLEQNPRWDPKSTS